MKLYYSPGACSLSPHIVATEAGLPVEAEKVNLAEHKTESGEDYMKINPKGYVPALRLDDGSVLTEGPAIVQYLADQNPSSGLAPKAGTIERYRLQEWLNFIGTELHKSFAPLFTKTASDDAKNTAKTNINKRLAISERPAREPPIPDGEQLHGRRRLRLHHYKLDELRRDRSQALSECRGLPGSHCRTPEGARNIEGRRSREVTSRGELR